MSPKLIQREPSLRELKTLTRCTQLELAHFVGTTQPNVSRWLRGQVKPEGVNAVVITLALMIARESPELLRCTLDIERPGDTLAVIERVLGTTTGLHYWLGLSSPYAPTDLKDTQAMCRLAIMLDVASVFLPGLVERIRSNYSRGITAARAARAERVKMSDERTKAKRAEWVKNRQRLRDTQ